MERLEFQFGNELFSAGADRVLIHPTTNSMLVADCHFGKASHFRKHNVPIPQKAGVRDFLYLQNCLEDHQPDRCIFLGDLFHSASNHEWLWLQDLLKSHPKTQFILVEGNHDILPLEHYMKIGMPVMDSLLLGNEILLTHIPLENAEQYNICGHIHPGFSIYGKGRQHLSFPCFFITKKQLIMPSFGRLTGFVTMNKRVNGGRAICIGENKLYAVDNN